MFLIAALLSFASAMASEKVIVLYSNENCGSCKVEKKSLDELGIKYVYGSGDKNAGIQFYPTIIVLIDGKESFRIVGSRSREELKKLLK